MIEALRVIKSLVEAQVIEKFALGGAIAALYYTEAIDTEDLDVFVLLQEPVSLLMPLVGIYENLKGRGYRTEGEHIIIEGVPVQFLPAYNALITEAVNTAPVVEFETEQVPVPAPEYLMAIMLQTGRQKDRLRFQLFQEQVAFDVEKLKRIADEFQLNERLSQWNQPTI